MGQRIISGIVAGAAFIGLLIAGGWYYTALLLLLAVIGYWEYVKLNGQDWTRLDVLISFVGMLLVALPRMPFDLDMPSFTTVTWVLMFILLSGTVFSKNRIQLEHVSILFLGAVYVGAGFTTWP